jgi:hypothetical protein
MKRIFVVSVLSVVVLATLVLGPIFTTTSGGILIPNEEKKQQGTVYHGRRKINYY